MDLHDRLAKIKMNPTQIVILSFAAVILTGSILLSLPIATRSGSIRYIDALFTATSAVCVTGLVVVDTGTYYTVFGQVVIMLLIQLGGLGLMTMSTLLFILLGRKIGLRGRLIMQEALNQLTLAGVIRLTKHVVIMTMVAEGIGALILSARFALDYGLAKGVYYGIFHAVSAFCNAGFDLIGNFRSFTPYTEDIVINLTLSSLFIIGGLGFSVVAEVYAKRRWSKLSLHSKLVLTITPILLLFGTAVLFVMESANPATMGPLSIKGKLLASYFHSATPRTAGFNTIDTGSMTTAALFFTIILMFIGASPASTGGGIKTTTFGVLVLAVLSVIGGKEDIGIYGKRIARVLVERALAVAIISLMLVVAVTMILSFTEVNHAGFLQVLFETTSAFGTVGLSTGITSGLTSIGRVFIIITMFAGRVGPLSLVVALTQQQRHAAFHYSEEKILVG